MTLHELAEKQLTNTRKIVYKFLHDEKFRDWIARLDKDTAKIVKGLIKECNYEKLMYMFHRALPINEWTIRRLRTLASGLHIPYYGEMHKAKLLEAIKGKYDKQRSPDHGNWPQL